MVIDTVTNESILDQYGGVRINSLDHILSLDNDDESKLFQTSNYYSEESMADIFSANINSFNILSLNCQSINAQIDELKIKLNEMKNRNCVFDAICLQETWLSNDADTSLFKLEGYKIISKGKTCSAHGGLLIYLNSSYHYKNILTDTTSDIWEGQLISVSNHTTKKNYYWKYIQATQRYKLKLRTV